MLAAAVLDTMTGEALGVIVAKGKVVRHTEQPTVHDIASKVTDEEALARRIGHGNQLYTIIEAPGSRKGIKKARDGDGDGFIHDGTPQQRPVHSLRTIKGKAGRVGYGFTQEEIDAALGDEDSVLDSRLVMRVESFADDGEKVFGVNDPDNADEFVISHYPKTPLDFSTTFGGKGIHSTKRSVAHMSASREVIVDDNGVRHDVLMIDHLVVARSAGAPKSNLDFTRRKLATELYQKMARLAIALDVPLVHDLQLTPDGRKFVRSLPAGATERARPGPNTGPRGLRSEFFKAARDGDGDGLVNDGTPMERPVHSLKSIVSQVGRLRFGYTQSEIDTAMDVEDSITVPGLKLSVAERHGTVQITAGLAKPIYGLLDDPPPGWPADEPARRYSEGFAVGTLRAAVTFVPTKSGDRVETLGITSLLVKDLDGFTAKRKGLATEMYQKLSRVAIHRGALLVHDDALTPDGERFVRRLPTGEREQFVDGTSDRLTHIAKRETHGSISRSLSPGFRKHIGYAKPIPERRGKKRRPMHPNPKSTPKEIHGRHGHRPHGPSILWPALYEHLRARGKTKEAAAKISNAAWKKKRMGLPTNAPMSARGVAKVPLRKSDVKLYYFEGRNTGIAASSPEEARRKKKRGGQKIVAVRTPNEQERKDMRAGRWVRTRADGKSPATSALGRGRGYGPPRKAAV